MATVLLTGCASDELVDTSIPNTGSSKSYISFTTNQKNTTRAKKLQDAGHYNFGVFAYKSTDKVNNIMDNYLVGYYDVANGYGTQTGSTIGDPTGEENGKSYWMYEGMGNAEYFGKYAGQDLIDAYKSNNANQYLKYWDNAADYTCFYAYAPYINGAGTATYVDGTAQGGSSDTYVLTIPNGSIKEGYNDESLCEYMYASKKVAKANYGIDVPLEFKRLNAKVNIKFWEDIPGYTVRILDLKEGTYAGVQAAPSIVETGAGKYGYKAGKYYTANGVKIKFADGVKNSFYQFAGTTASTEKPLVFAAPTAAQIGETRQTASASDDTYYAIPKGDSQVITGTSNNIADLTSADEDLAKTGFTFHVSYELTSDTGERIVVKNATAHVPFTYANWEENTHYTYIFKITTDSNGSTDPADDGDIDPTDPEVPTVQSLYPIVFDNCTVEDWLENETEYDITDGTTRGYYSLMLSQYSMTNSQDNVLNVTVKRESKKLGNGTITDATVTVVGPDSYDDTKISTAAGKITVAAGATVGTYTVTYDVPADDIDKNQPRTITTTFTVGNAYTVATNLNEVGTAGLAAAYLQISTTKATTGTGYAAETTPEGIFKIEYPINVTPSAKVTIEGTTVKVATDAEPGAYTVAYVVDGKTVARHEFNVVKYTFALNKTVVGLTDAAQDITATTTGGGKLSVASTPGITTDGTKVTVASTASEGEYTVTYTVNGESETVSKIQYSQNFKVYNTYAVTLSKATIQRDLGRENDADQGTDKIQITRKKNNVTVTDGTLTVVDENGADVTAQFTISAAGELKVNKTAATGNYKVKYVGQAANTDGHDYTVVAAFVVQQ